MDRSQIRLLKTLTLESRPLTSHTIAWSCDAELAVATEDAIYVFIPEYARVSKGDEAEGSTAGLHQYSLSLRAAEIFRPEPLINLKLCAFSGVDLDYQWDPNRTGPPQYIGNGPVTRAGGTVCQVVGLEWSPDGLGENLRPVLTAMLSTGQLLTLGEHRGDTPSNAPAGMPSRSTKTWRILWGLGAGLPLPAEDYEGKYRSMDEYIKSYSWAKKIDSGQALLAYLNDEGEIAIMSVQRYRQPEAVSSTTDDMWQIQEVDRFEANGPHGAGDTADPDYVPNGSALSLQWGPWSHSQTSQTATLAYIARNYVGFRQVTIQKPWKTGEPPTIEVAETDTIGICTYLSIDAFVKWEDMIWESGGKRTSRGVICTPFEVKPFEIPLNDPPRPQVRDHHTTDCATTYSANLDTNPISGLIIHPVDPSQKPQVPVYSLVRASATATNHDWYQTNDPNAGRSVPQWVKRIRRSTQQRVTRATAMNPLDSYSDSDESDVESDPEDTSNAQIRPHRYRIWGLASSPGGGSSAIISSKYSTTYPQRRGMCVLSFAWRARNDDNIPSPTMPLPLDLTTEGLVWEWMYGCGEDVPFIPGVTAPFYQSSVPLDRESPVHALFADLSSNQMCVFCDAKLQNDGNEARCSNEHTFATCTVSGLAILEPGVSRVCAVCERRCLERSRLLGHAKELLGPDTALPALPEICGSCGGKFVA